MSKRKRHDATFPERDAPSGLTIRPAQLSDARTLCNAERETARIPGRLASQRDELHEADFAAKILELADAGCYRVAERDGRIVGHAFLGMAGPHAAVAHVRTLTIVAHPGCTGQGVGTALLQALLEWVRQQTLVQRVELRVRETNVAARRLYEKCGFAEEARFRRRIRLPDGTLIDDIGMTWFRPEAQQ